MAFPAGHETNAESEFIMDEKQLAFVPANGFALVLIFIVTFIVGYITNLIPQTIIGRDL